VSTSLDRVVRKKRVRSLLDAARSVASGYFEFHPGGLPIAMAPPRIIGPGRCEEVRGTSRIVFAAALDDALLRPQSSFIELQDDVLLDYQGRELEAIPLEFEYDPAIIASDGREATVFDEPDAPFLDTPEALSLLGCTAPAFGHWIVEYLLQWATASERIELRNLPVLIDDNLPATHRQALEYFLEGRAPVLVAPAVGAFRLRRAWKVSNWIYVAMRPVNEEALDPRFQVSPAHEIAARFARLAERIDRDLGDWHGPQRVFLARHASRHRKLVNAERIEAAARERGFEVIYPEDLDFRDQVRLVRGATHIMGPEGSALFLAFFARPGTKLCCLDHPFVEKHGTASTIFAALGVELVLLTGRCVRKDERYARFSDYEVAEPDLRTMWDEWGMLDLHGALR
jgi:hypothetical protein